MGLMMLLTVKEVASYLQTSKQQVRRMIQSGELTAVRVGREYRVPGSCAGNVVGGEYMRLFLSRNLRFLDEYRLL